MPVASSVFVDSPLSSFVTHFFTLAKEYFTDSSSLGTAFI